jgi:CRISPR-associated protein (TIGR02710 family)
MARPAEAPDTIVLTVGTGDRDRLDETLLAPLRLSMRKGGWRRIVLLPSHATRLHGIEGLPVPEIEPLPRPGDEDDADACFAHFDRVLAGLIDEGVAPERIVADFTRGTKAMSAALVLAAIGHRIPRLRYLTGDERDARGMVVTGRERAHDIGTERAMFRRQLDLARDLLASGNFAAAERLLAAPPAPDAKPEGLNDAVSAACELCRFYAAWDRFDYAAAAAVDLREEVRRLGPGWSALAPSAEVRAWVGQLAADAGDQERQPEALRRLACDLLANGERRLRGGGYEDALLRAYRVLELMGQIRLLDQGLDSECIKPDHPAVQRYNERRARAGKPGLEPGEDGTIKAGRDRVVGLLKTLNDPLAKSLGRFDNKFSAVKARNRNRSVLVHGYRAAGSGDPAQLGQMYRELETLLNEEMKETNGMAARLLALARRIPPTLSG